MRRQQIDEESTIRIVSNKQMRFEVELFMHKESNDDVIEWKSIDRSNDQIIWFLFFLEKINQLYHVMIVSSYHLNFYHCIASSSYLSTILIVFSSWFCRSARINHHLAKFFTDVAIESHDVCKWIRINVLHICIREFCLQTDLKMIDDLIILWWLIIHIYIKIDKIMTEWSINKNDNHWLRIFHWFKDDYECLSIILFKEWEWRWKFNH